MVTFTCKEMSGGQPWACEESFSGETAENIAEQGMAHMQSAHPDIAKQMEPEMTEEKKAEWMADFQKKFDARKAEAAE